jgi:hypothetical protein
MWMKEYQKAEKDFVKSKSMTKNVIILVDYAIFCKENLNWRT